MRNRDWSAPRLCNAARSSRSIIGGTTMVKTRTAIIIRRLAFTRKTVEEAGWGRAVPSLRQRVDNGYAAHGAVSTTFQAGLKFQVASAKCAGVAWLPRPRRDRCSGRYRRSGLVCEADGRVWAFSFRPPGHAVGVAGNSGRKPAFPETQAAAHHSYSKIEAKWRQTRGKLQKPSLKLQKTPGSKRQFAPLGSSSAGFFP